MSRIQKEKKTTYMGLGVFLKLLLLVVPSSKSVGHLFPVAEKHPKKLLYNLYKWFQSLFLMLRADKVVFIPPQLLICSCPVSAWSLSSTAADLLSCFTLICAASSDITMKDKTRFPVWRSARGGFRSFHDLYAPYLLIKCDLLTLQLFI